MRLFRAVCLICCLLVPHLREDDFEDTNYFPAYYISPDSAFGRFAAAVYWISGEWKKNAPYEIGYPLLYSMLLVLPLLPFLSLLIPYAKSLLLQQANERKRQQEIDRLHQEENEREQSGEEYEILTDKNDGEYFDPEMQPGDITPQASIVCSKNASSVGKRLATAGHVTNLELHALRVVKETSSTDRSEEGEVTVVHEQLPDLATIDATASFERLKELGARICPESVLGKACVAVASGVLISYGIYRLFSK